MEKFLSALCWMIWETFFLLALFFYLYFFIDAIPLIPLYSIIINAILIVGIMITSIVKKDKFYFKQFKLYFIGLLICHFTFSIVNFIIFSDSNSNSPLNINMQELTILILNVIIPVSTYLLCLLNENKK
ncbi:hypothetical protein A9G45_01410 [Gilliamella sp. HK2]|jgi:hypothetical protein|uniref:hypothetical protein n=1 Tax=unclassified Gilliamella TaxID=2685620 RepID=UPI00080DBB86|nr:hypothetical protein [Gilliamella apicola]OCG28982.1 hypothetical protein A9G46_01695 [Gilliamella apicola]OCG31453.1 hypothetical protein A9G45_01410 [Gilliamella apicola]